MGECTIRLDGVDIPDFGEQRFPYAVIEVTRRCNLRCKTCFFFQARQHEEGDLPEEELLAKLRTLQRRHEIKFMSWVGGEPLLRPGVIAEAPRIFERNVIFTNGLLPIPDIPVAIGVSLDGPPEFNDAIRGAGVYEKVRRNISTAPRPIFIQSVLTKHNFGEVERFTAEIAEWPNVRGVVYSLYIPQRGVDGDLAFSLGDRDPLIMRLLSLKERYESFIHNERRALELALSATCKAVTDHCDMKTNSLALDYRLRRRRPCCYGENIDCDLCAAPTPFSIAARREARLAQATGESVPAVTLPDAMQRREPDASSSSHRSRAAREES